jgi:ribosomal protein S18 acetylase RimI-like enzyme
METRAATVIDAALITQHRKAMFASMGSAEEPVLNEMSRNFEPWVARMLAEGKYFGWITNDAARPVASAGLLILDWAPHYLDPAGEFRGYLLNVFVEAEYRKRGLARNLIDICMADARRRGIRVVALHASATGKSLYEKMGFSTTNEMLYVDLVDDQP